MTRALCLAALLLSALPAEGAAPSPADAYRAVMAAQIHADAKPKPVMPAEAQRIMDIYLRSLGQKPAARSLNSGNDQGMPPR
jgi:hypothetical protein